MLYDKARIFVQGGGGGDGCMSFRREAHVPMGGPDGGDGGHGGDVVFVCDDSFRDLQAFKRRAHYKAPRGRHGEGAQRHGSSGDTLFVPVPPGTQITDLDGTVHDLVIPGRKVVIARGGSGGRGNRCFTPPTRQAPRFAERGIVGDEGWVELRLKLLADVGLVGLPNAGKSSLLARLTRAAPKVAQLPVHDARADARHARRQRAPAHRRRHPRADRGRLRRATASVTSSSRTSSAPGCSSTCSTSSRSTAPIPTRTSRSIENELELHDPRLASLPRILVLSKADLVSPEKAEEARARWQARFDAAVPAREAWEPDDPFAATPVLITSAATGLGLDELTLALFRRVPVLAPATPPTGSTRHPGPVRASPTSSTSCPPIRRSAPRPVKPGRSSTSTRASSASRVLRSSACSPDTTWRTRTRWPTSSTAWARWASSAPCRRRGSSQVTTSRSTAWCSSWTDRRRQAAAETAGCRSSPNSTR